MNKRIVFGVCAVSVFGTGFVGFPVFADDAVDISIVEEVDAGGGTYKPWEDITGAMPGDVYSAIPRVRNNGTESASVIMCLSESATNSAGETISIPVNSFEISINGNWVLDSESSNNASDPASGNCYRYNTMVNAGAVSEPLFSEIGLNSALANEYQGASFNLHLSAYASSTDPDEPIGPDGPVVPEKPADGGSDGTGGVGAPNNPDTGVNTASYLEIVSPVLISAGVIAFFAVFAYMIRRYLKRGSK